MSVTELWNSVNYFTSLMIYEFNECVSTVDLIYRQNKMHDQDIYCHTPDRILTINWNVVYLQTSLWIQEEKEWRIVAYFKLKPQMLAWQAQGKKIKCFLLGEVISPATFETWPSPVENGSVNHVFWSVMLSLLAILYVTP
jgi:hypothetical protein